MVDADRVDVAVIGGGVAGLSAAWFITQANPQARVVVLEASDRVGGKLRHENVAGHQVDVGAESVLARRPEAVDLIRSVGLGERIVEPLTSAAGVHAEGSTRPLPQRTLFGIPGDLEAVTASKLLSDEGLSRLRQEGDLPPLEPLAADVTVGALVRRRLGDEVVDKLVDPLLGGVYAGRADDLSLAAAIPTLYRYLQTNGGTLLEAVTQLMTPRPGGSTSPYASPFISVRGGIAKLPKALASTGRFTIRTNSTVTKVEGGGGEEFTLRCVGPSGNTALRAHQVILATPPNKAAQLLSVVAPTASRLLAHIQTASMAIISFAFDRPAVEAGQFPAGSGQLIASTEHLVTKAVTYSSQKWPDAPRDLFFLRASVGRAGEVAPLQWDDADLLLMVRADLKKLTGLTAEPVDAVITRWGGGLPQYAVGHVDVVRQIREAVAAVGGLAVCGASYDGVGIAACIGSAHAAARLLEEASQG